LTELATVAAVAFTVNAPAAIPRPMNHPRLFASLLALAAATSAFADNPVTGVIAIPFPTQRATAIALVQPADYLCATVTLSSRAKDPARQAEEIRETSRQLSAAVSKSPLLQIHEGTLRFYGGGGAGFDSSYTSRLLSLPSSAFSSSSGGSPLFSSSVRVLYKLDGSQNDTFQAATALRKLVDTLATSNPTSVHISSLTLAVEAPERQRERLLSLIRESAEAMKKTFHADTVTIGGLDGPVLVRQVDDASVELFIDYTLSVSASK
jgi:hypothetical protein